MPTVVELEPEGKSKLTRATPAIIRAEHGLFYLPHEAAWCEDFESEHCQFTGDDRLDAYSDQVDCSAYAVLGQDKYGMVPSGEPFLCTKSEQLNLWEGPSSQRQSIPPPHHDDAFGRQVPRRGRVGW